MHAWLSGNQASPECARCDGGRSMEGDIARTAVTTFACKMAPILPGGSLHSIATTFRRLPTGATDTILRLPLAALAAIPGG